MTVFYAARRYDDQTLFLVDPFGAGSPEHRHTDTARHPLPNTYPTLGQAWAAARRDRTLYGSVTHWTPVVVTEAELLELERTT
jgi:hypothetical protein